MASFRVTAPAQDTAYFRSSDWQSTNGSGPQVQNSVSGASFLNSKVGPTGNWHPTILWLLGFVVVELAAYHVLSHYVGI